MPPREDRVPPPARKTDKLYLEAARRKPVGNPLDMLLPNPHLFRNPSQLSLVSSCAPALSDHVVYRRKLGFTREYYEKQGLVYPSSPDPSPASSRRSSPEPANAVAGPSRLREQPQRTYIGRSKRDASPNPLRPTAQNKKGKKAPLILSEKEEQIEQKNIFIIASSPETPLPVAKPEVNVKPTNPPVSHNTSTSRPEVSSSAAAIPVDLNKEFGTIENMSAYINRLLEEPLEKMQADINAAQSSITKFLAREKSAAVSAKVAEDAKNAAEKEKNAKDKKVAKDIAKLKRYNPPDEEGYKEKNQIISDLEQRVKTLEDTNRALKGEIKKLRNRMDRGGYENMSADGDENMDTNSNEGGGYTEDRDETMNGSGDEDTSEHSDEDNNGYMASDEEDKDQDIIDSDEDTNDSHGEDTEEQVTASTPPVHPNPLPADDEAIHDNPVHAEALEVEGFEIIEDPGMQDRAAAAIPPVHTIPRNALAIDVDLNLANLPALNYPTPAQLGRYQTIRNKKWIRAVWLLHPFNVLNQNHAGRILLPHYQEIIRKSGVSASSFNTITHLDHKLFPGLDTNNIHHEYDAKHARLVFASWMVFEAIAEGHKLKIVRALILAVERYWKDTNKWRHRYVELCAKNKVLPKLGMAITKYQKPKSA